MAFFQGSLKIDRLVRYDQEAGPAFTGAPLRLTLLEIDEDVSAKGMQLSIDDYGEVLEEDRLVVFTCRIDDEPETWAGDAADYGNSDC